MEAVPVVPMSPFRPSRYGEKRSQIVHLALFPHGLLTSQGKSVNHFGSHFTDARFFSCAAVLFCFASLFFLFSAALLL